MVIVEFLYKRTGLVESIISFVLLALSLIKVTFSDFQTCCVVVWDSRCVLFASNVMVSVASATVSLVYPQGAFYLFMQSPMPDANLFCQKAREYELLLVPSDSFGVEGYVRISYCVAKEMILASLSAFKALAEDLGLCFPNA